MKNYFKMLDQIWEQMKNHPVKDIEPDAQLGSARNELKGKSRVGDPNTRKS